MFKSIFKPTNRPIFKQKSPLLFTLGTACLLTGGGALAYWGLSKHGAVGSNLPAGSQFIPQEALMTLTVTTQEGQWNRLRQFGNAETQQELDNLIVQWRDRILSVNGYRFKQDIKPWVGEEVTVAFLPKPLPKPSSSNPGTPPNSPSQNLVLVLPIADPLKAKELLQSPKTNDVSWIGREYKGVQIQSVKSPTGETLETAVLGTDWLVIANSKTNIERVIDIAKGDPAISDTTGYRQAMQRIESPQAFAQIYINMPAARQNIGSGDQGIPLGDSQGLAATLSLQQDGVHVAGTSWLNAESKRNYSDIKNTPTEMPRRLPNDVLMMMSGSNLQQLWQSFSNPENPAPFLFFSPEALRTSIQTFTGLNLEEDFMPWMKGEFAFALLPPPAAPQQPSAGDKNANPPRLGQLLLMVKASDRQAAETTWQELDEVVKTRYRFEVKAAQAKEQTITEWVSPFEAITLSHGWLDGNITFFSIGPTVIDSIAPRPKRSLAETGLFQSLIDQAPNENNGHFFVDLQKLNQQQDALPLPVLTPNLAITSAIEAIGVTATVHNDRAINYDIVVKLTKNNPQALPEPTVNAPIVPKSETDEDKLNKPAQTTPSTPSSAPSSAP
jgi:Protein of unknown function (DUF3352)